MEQVLVGAFEVKKIGIMQPYYFPYLGYWQLMNAVDEYVIYDDVNYIKGGWINRNRILVNGSPQYINLQLSQPSPNKKINEIKVGEDERTLKKLLMTLEMNYKKAPFFHEVFPILEHLITSQKGILSDYIAETFKVLNDYLGIETKLIMSSELNKDNSLKGQDKVIDICKCLGGTSYYNAIGGQKLYDYEAFSNNGIELKFLEMEDIAYKQFSDTFVPGLSIIDVMMFNSVEKIHSLLNQYKIISK